MKLRAVTYNIHKCVGGFDRRYDPGRTAAVLAECDADVIMLQEVAQAAPKLQNERQVERLGDLLGFDHRAYFTNVKKRGKGGEYGNAILSRHPLSAVENIDVTVPPKKRRCVLHAKVEIKTGEGAFHALHLFNLHLGLSGIERSLQLRKLLETPRLIGLEDHAPVLIAGDFNDVWESLGNKLTPHGFRRHSTKHRTFPAIRPIRALDSVYVRGNLELRSLQAPNFDLARAASDHLPLVADLTIT